MVKHDLKYNQNEKIDFMNIDETDFESMTLAEKKRHLEVEGYVVLPNAVDSIQIEKIKLEMKDAPMQTKDYSNCQTFHLQPQWYSKAVASLIATPFCKAHLKDICAVVHLYFFAKMFNSSYSNILPLATEQ